ncbi:zinc finger protein 800-like [Myxocyprinus asiaticus]|uniref:zinc finger protein 800-like n=1 Tax=Myxocyprinus asiaticus TaxID=70543 RepID=UPI002223E497|nr:zinc finger protein 800-like [Myxocyprinus asiaticus]
MEELMSKAHPTPANDKCCQTDDIPGEAFVPGPDHASKTFVNSTETGDPPLLQTPLQTSKSGIQQIIECFRTGTAQLKHILLKEVDTIFECKLCRSLFRGLPNLIKHKEIYCLPRLHESDDTSEDGKKGMKELLEAIYPHSDKQEYFLTLEPIASNQNAVYQHLSKEEDLPSSSQSPNQTSTSSLAYYSNIQEQHTEEVNVKDEEIREENCTDEHEVENMSDGEDAVELKEYRDSEEPVGKTEDADIKDCKCLLCNRTYRGRGHLQRHLRTVHKIVTSSSDTNSTDSNFNAKKPVNGSVPETHDNSPSSSSENKVPCKPVFSIGFDFKTRFCKLCRRTFSSEQNLVKHIELHTDNGTDFYVKFYCCPLCRYKTRRKRDVLRHLSELHKKKSAYLSRISQSLESCAVKKPAEVVLNKDEAKSQHRQDVNINNNHSSPYLTRRNLLPNMPGALCKKTSKVSNKVRHAEKVTNSTEVKPDGAKGNGTKKSLHVCKICGQAFKKERYLGLHKRSHHKTAARSATGIRTRSKVVI